MVADLKRRANTIVILIPSGLVSLLQPLDRMLNKQMTRLMQGKYTTYTASAIADPKTGKLIPPGRGAVSMWCKESWEANTTETVKTFFKIFGLALALDGSEDHAWCTHNFGEDYRKLLQQQRVEWEAAHPDVTSQALQRPEVPVASDTNPITATGKELREVDSDVELVDGLGDGGAEGEKAVEL